jgi:hypothetical protein
MAFLPLALLLDGVGLTISRLAGAQQAERRGARVDEWAGLESRCGALLHRGFESRPLRLGERAPDEFSHVLTARQHVLLMIR